MKANLRGAIFYVFLAVALVLGAELVIYDTSGGSPVYAIVSSSMAPTLDVGDLALVGTVPFSSIHVGDVIVFSRPTADGTCGSEIIVHRVVGIASGGGLITQGDDLVRQKKYDDARQVYAQAASLRRGPMLLQTVSRGWSWCQSHTWDRSPHPSHLPTTTS